METAIIFVVTIAGASLAVAFLLLLRGVAAARRHAENRMLAEIIMRENAIRLRHPPLDSARAFGRVPKARIIQVGAIIDLPDRIVVYGWLFDPFYVPEPRSFASSGEELYWGYSLAELREIERCPSEFVDV